MRIPSFIASLLGIICLTQACAQPQPVLSRHGLDMLMLGGAMLFHHKNKGVEVFDLHPEGCAFRDTTTEADPENSIEQPPGFEDEQPVIYGEVEGLSVWIQGDGIVFQRKPANSPKLSEDDHGLLFNAMQQQGIQTISSDANSTEFIPDDITAESFRINKISEFDPLPTGIDLIDQNPAIHQVSQQARERLAILLLAVKELTDHAYSRSIEASHASEIDNEEEEPSIIFDLGGQLYSTEKPDEAPKRVSERIDEIELIYDDEILELYRPETSSDDFSRGLSFIVRKCGNGEESNNDGGKSDSDDNDSSSDEKTEQATAENSEDAAEANPEAPAAKRIKTDADAFWESEGNKIIKIKEELLRQLKRQQQVLSDKKVAFSKQRRAAMEKCETREEEKRVRSEWDKKTDLQLSEIERWCLEELTGEKIFNVRGAIERLEKRSRSSRSRARKKWHMRCMTAITEYPMNTISVAAGNFPWALRIKSVPGYPVSVLLRQKPGKGNIISLAGVKRTPTKDGLYCPDTFIRRLRMKD